MKFSPLLLLFPLILFADECQNLLDKSIEAFKKKDSTMAANLSAQAAKICEKKHSIENENTMMAIENSCTFYLQANKPDKAQEFCAKFLDIFKKHADENNANLAKAYANMGLVNFQKEDYKVALEHFQKAMAIRQIKLGAHLDTAQSYKQVGITFSKLGEHEKAIAHIKSAIEILENSQDRKMDKAFGHSILAQIYADANQPQNALEQYTKAHTAFLRMLGEKNQLTKQAKQNMDKMAEILKAKKQ